VRAHYRLRAGTTDTPSFPRHLEIVRAVSDLTVVGEARTHLLNLRAFASTSTVADKRARQLPASTRVENGVNDPGRSFRRSVKKVNPLTPGSLTPCSAGGDEVRSAGQRSS
jgi:hypothetical protein